MTLDKRRASSAGMTDDGAINLDERGTEEANNGFQLFHYQYSNKANFKSIKKKTETFEAVAGVCG